jgi:hypothetical protein
MFDCLLVVLLDNATNAQQIDLGQPTSPTPKPRRQSGTMNHEPTYANGWTGIGGWMTETSEAVAR